jgi:Fe-S cluster assembly protein SufD
MSGVSPLVEAMNNPVVIDLHSQHTESRSGNDPAWLKSTRAQALEQFTRRGFPTTRDEEWKFTNVAPIAKANFILGNAQHANVTSDHVRQFDVPELDAAARVVFINGAFAPRLSTIKVKGVQLLPLREAVQSHRDLVQPHLEGHVLHNAKADAFTLMNSAFAEEGAVIHISRGAVIEQPIELLSISTASDEPFMTHPRNIIIAQESSECTIIERYMSLDAGGYFTNAVTDVHVGENATVNHYLIEEEGGEAFNISTLRTHQLANSNCASHTILLGGKLVRNNVHSILDGEGAECLINGLFIGSDAQHMDNHMRVEHAKPHGDSRQFYKGILDDRSTAVFSGRIIVHPGAQKTDAKQTNKNLLLSREAHVDTQPQLEIYADDVKCTHGATIGQMDEQAVFYLRARGISNDAARSMLIHAFAGESLTRMNNQAIRTYLDKILFARLPGGDLLEHML